MDFAAVLERIAGYLSARGQPYAVVGGVALAAYGIARTTLDLDIVVDAAIQDDLVRFVEAAGYETLHRSAGYSNHLHPDPAAGRVDFVYVRGATSSVLFGGLRRVPGPRGGTIPVPKPEHLAAMKIQAMRDDPGRALQEMADLRSLLLFSDVDRDVVRSELERQGMRERWDEIVATL